MRHAAAFICAIIALLNQAAIATPPQPLKGRIIQSLNGPWKHKSDPTAEGINKGWQRSIPSDAEEVALPAGLRERRDGVEWYWREFRLPKLWQTANVRIQLPPGTGPFDLFINGKAVTTSGHPRILDITKQADATSTNILAIRLEGAAPGPDKRIPADIDLIVSDEAYIEDAEITLEPADWIKVRVNLRNASDKTGDADLLLDVSPADQPRRKIASTLQTIVISPGRNRTDLTIRIKRPKNAGQAGYIAMIELRQNRDLLDNLRAQFTLPATRTGP